MSFTVREFEERDAARAAEIMYESFKTFFKERWGEDKRGTAEEYKKFLRSETPGNLSVAFVAEEEGKVIGFLHVTASTACGLGVLHSIGVDPQVFSKGVGRAMVAEAEKLWRKLRMRKIYTCTSHINQRALAFYKSLGFEEEGLLKEHFMEGIDEIQLGKFYKYND
jgi:ribosomal protein S18 acetylase RimI-like enzyme